MTRYGTDPLTGSTYALRQKLKSSEMNNGLGWWRGLDAGMQLMAITNWPWSLSGVATTDQMFSATYFTATDQWFVVGTDWASGLNSAVWKFRHPGQGPSVANPTNIGKLSCVASNSSVIVAGTNDTGSTAQKILSSNGTSWTARNLSGATTESVMDICWDSTNSLFVAVLTGDKIETSPDGITWTSRTTSGSTFDFIGVSSNGSIIVATCYGPASSFDTSTDGVTWTARTVPSGTYTGRAAYHTGWDKWFAATTTTVIESANGTTWAAGSATHPESGSACKMVEFGDYMVSLVAAPGNDLAIYVSDDECVNWTHITDTTSIVGAYYFDIVTSGEQLCVCADYECMFSFRAPTSL